MIDIRDEFVSAIFNEMAAACADDASRAFFARKRAEREQTTPKVELPAANHD